MIQGLNLFRNLQSQSILDIIQVSMTLGSNNKGFRTLILFATVHSYVLTIIRSLLWRDLDSFLLNIVNSSSQYQPGKKCRALKTSNFSLPQGFGIDILIINYVASQCLNYVKTNYTLSTHYMKSRKKLDNLACCYIDSIIIRCKNSP